MTERRFNDPRRGGSRYGGGRPDENAQPARPEPKRDPGAYIGRMPERSIGSAQGGFAPRDRRDNAPAPQPQPQTQTQTQPEPVAVNASVTPESPAAPRTAEPAAATPSKESSESTESRAGTEAPVAAATAAGTTATAPETGQGS
jgi:hypothetical protein